MIFTQNLLQIFITILITSCFDGPNVLCDGDRDLKETEVLKVIDKCGYWDEQSTAPWSVAIFDEYGDMYRHICDGSIVSPNVVIAAAQCFKHFVRTIFLDSEEFYVVAGRYNTSLEKDKFAETNYVKVRTLHLSPEYKDIVANFTGNLAALVLEEPFQITNLVQPVCFDRNNKIESQHLFHNNHGTEGWNIDQYQYIEVNASDMIDLNKCFKKIKSDYHTCVESVGPAVCQNIGGGIILKDKQQFYIRGVIGYTPTIKRDGCDPDLHYGVFTNISNHYEFILSIIDGYEIKTGDCPGLTTIDNGNFEFLVQRQRYILESPVRNFELVNFTCDNNYALHPTTPVVTCLDGNFTIPIPKCKNECGYWDQHPPAPWNVALYHKEENDNYKLLCGGSIITANIIITAATCIIIDDITEKIPAEELYVAAGKYFSHYNNVEDEFAQNSQVNEYHIPPKFTGGRHRPLDSNADPNFTGDLAVVVLKHPFHTTNLVAPVCLDRNNQIEPRQITLNNTGIVTAWSYLGSNELEQSNTTYINYEECLDTYKDNRITEEFTSDKFCAHYIRDTNAGGGIAYKWNTNNKQQFYIRGVNTFKQYNSGIGLFTNITFHKEFILKIIDEQLRTESCPSITIENGQFNVLGQDYKPEESILNYNVVNLTCSASYLLHPANPTVVCIDGNWNVPIPQCKLTCPPIISSSADVTCTVDGNPVDCSQPLVEGAVARSKCKLFYIKSGYDIPISTCSNGSWSNPVVRCAPECGEEISKGVTYIIKGNNAKKGEFPWHIAVYSLVKEKYKYQCGGSIINPLIIITAAHCFTHDGVLREPADKFHIGAGKYYSDYSAKDIFVQKRQVKEYHISTEYRGHDSNYAGDLAVVVVTKAFVMTNVVQPVCVDWVGSLESEQLKHNNTGSVVGWGYVVPNVTKESTELNQLNPPFIDRDQCLNKVPSNFRRWVTLDKFCAGFTNGTSLCRGDSGGGLVFKENNMQRYFIRGVVSVGPLRKGERVDDCDEFQYGVYTQISYYNNFILNIIAANPVKN